MHFLCRIAASLCRCITAPPSVFCRYLLILSLNLMASVAGWLARSLLATSFVGCSWLLIAAIWGNLSSFAVPWPPSRHLRENFMQISHRLLNNGRVLIPSR
ncbi:hypothetical protein V8C86DRAFT_2544134 [Haematococcus lacustris]